VTELGPAVGSMHANTEYLARLRRQLRRAEFAIGLLVLGLFGSFACGWLWGVACGGAL